MNPYQWIGIDPNIKNPNHFQLLGIKSQLTDETEFVLQVQKNVKAKLTLLDRPELASQADLVNKLKQRILVAGGILTDSAKRNQYVEQLKVAAQDSARTAPPSASGKSAVDRSKSSSANPSRGSSSSSSRGLSTPSSQPAANGDSEEIPLAIPMRKPVKDPHAASSSSSVKPASKIRNDDNESALEQDFSALGVAALKTRPLTRRKKSPLMVVAGSLIAIAAMAGLVFAAINLSQPRRPEIAETINPIEQAVVDNLASSKSNGNSIDNDLQPLMNSDSQPESETKEGLETEDKLETEDPETGAPEAKINPESAPATTADSQMAAESNPADEMEAEQKPNDLDGGDASSSKQARPTILPMENELTFPPVEKPNDPASTNTNEEEEEEGEEEEGDPEVTKKPAEGNARAENQSANVWELDSENAPLVLAEADQYLIDKHLRIILNRQRLRHPDVAEYTNDLLEYIEKLYVERNPDKATPYSRILFAFKEVNEYLDGFWSQFEASAAATPGGQEIIVFDRPMSFVEYSDNQLVMRGQGFNIRYRREHIPAELAIKIAEQGAIPDIPSWRLYLAAFLATQQDGHIRNKERITEMLELSLEDGHDVSSVQDFLSFRKDPRPLKLKATMPDMNAIAAVARKVQDNSNGIIGVQMDELKLEEFFDHWMKWEFLWFTYAEDFKDDPEFQDEKPLIHTSLALLHNAILAAVMAKDAARLEEAIVELGYLTGENTDKTFLEHLTKIAAAKLDLPQAIELKRVSEPLIARVEEDRKLRPIANRIQKRNELFERQHRINGTGQTFGRLK